MNISDSLCMNCMKDMGEGTVCQHCGFDRSEQQTTPYLPFRTTLSSRYLVGRMLRHDSDGALYIGFDLSLKSPVYLHEFLPKRISSRTADTNDIKVRVDASEAFEECLRSFLELWRNMARLRSLSAIIPVYDIFEENGTAYAVEEYMDCVPLREYLLNIPTGYLPWEKAKVFFMPVLSTLGALHNAGIIHRAISPNTLLICKDGRMRIGGFRIWQSSRVGTALEAQLDPGYAAVEQYHAKEQQGAWTDIYGFTATLYRALIGNTPPEATLRVENDKLMVPARLAEQIPAYVINALVNGLQIFPAERTKTVDQLRAELSAAPSVTVQQATAVLPLKDAVSPAAPPDAQTKPGSNRKVAIISGVTGALIVLVLVILAVVFKDSLFGGGEAKTTAPVTDSTRVGSTNTAMVKVPNLISYNKASVESNAEWNKNFQFEYEYEFSNTEDNGRIFDQSVPADTMVNQGTVIKLTVSKGRKQIVLPNMVGRKAEEAKAELTAQGFQVSVIEIINDGTKVEGEVASVAPQAGQQYLEGQEVILQVYGAVPTTSPAQPVSNDA